MNDIELQKLPPQYIEAEESILSACLLGSSQDAIDILNPDDFYKTAHQKIFNAICELAMSNTEIDLVSVVGKMRDKSELEECGGAAYLSRLVDTVPSGTSVKHYAKMIKSASQKRTIIKTCAETIQDCYNGESVDHILGVHDLAISKIKTHSGSFYKIGDLLPEMIEKWEFMKSQPGPPGIPCGLTDIDRRFGGFQGSSLYVIGARPGMGKTGFGMRISRGAARSNFPVLQISLEMSKEQLVCREVSCESGIDGERFTTGEISNDQWFKIADSTSKISELPIWIDDTPTATIKEIQSKIRQFHKKHGRCLITIDYLDFIKGIQSDRKDLEIGTITKGLKASAKLHDIPIVLFVQLNRDCEKRDNKRPEIRDLRNSGEIEQDADVIAFLYRDEYYDPETDKKGVAEFIIRKYRNGKIGIVYLTWIGHRTTFESIMGQK